MAYLTSEEIAHFNDEGYVVIEKVIDESVLDAAIEEYEGVLERLIDDLIDQGKISDRFEGLEFGERFIQVCKATGDVHKQYFDFSLPFQDVRSDTPFWSGQAVLNLFTDKGLLDAVESLIGPEIYSNPVQHVRIKPPESILLENEFGNAILGATPWHQDNGVVVDEADDTEMLTVWFSLHDTAVEQGPLKVIPRSHKEKLLTHCPRYHGNGPVMAGANQIPEKLFDVEETRPLPVERGDVVFFHRHIVHGSFPNVSDKIRWSFDLRYHPIGQPTGREAFPGFVARSRKQPERALRDAGEWTRNWLETRKRMSRINQGGQKEVSFGRWKEDHLDCA